MTMMKNLILLLVFLACNHLVSAQWTSAGSTNFISTSHAASTNSFGLNLETSGSNYRYILENNISGGNQQAFYFGHANSTKNIFGISTSSSSGATWSPRFTVTQTGLVGIGTNSPKERFQIGNSYSFHDGGHKVIGFLYTPTGAVDLDASKYSAEIRFDPTSGNLRFGTSSAIDSSPVSHLYITKSGKFGTGTATPGARLEVGGSEGATPSILIRNKSYTSTHSAGTVALQFAFSNHIGPKVEAYKVSTNITGLKLYTEYGFNASQLAMTFKPTSSGTNVGIGTTNIDEKLTVNGNIRSEEVKVEVVDPPDYVFAKDYNLRTLNETEQFIDANQHLPEVPSAVEMLANGISLGEMNMLLLKKIEELTLHQIEQNKQIVELQKKVIAIEEKK